ncbi:glycosyltransferase [Candidimonas sp. SYP-B2681]|nr:glycosyltransferase [Candidimonas sp. SYP-B2681]
MSVVVPTYQRPDLLERCMNALLRQTMAPEAYEIIVCDDGPSLSAQRVVKSLPLTSGGRPLVRYIAVTATQGPAGARNAGWRAAMAPIIAFTDDDTVPDPGWLQSGALAMAVPADAAVGRIVMPLPENPSDYQKDAARLQDAEFATANCFVRRDALEAVGGFDERYTSAWREDSDLHFSLLKKGYTIVKVPEAVVVHPLRPARFAAGIAMQRKVMFDVLLYRKHPDLYRQRIRSGAPWFYLSVSACLVTTVAALLSGWYTLALASAMAWGGLSLFFFLRRLMDSSFTVRNVVELFVTSIFIPPLSIFWRAAGVVRFGWGVP